MKFSISIWKVIIISKVVVLSFSEDEEDICQRILYIISESSHFEVCNVIQVEKIVNTDARTIKGYQIAVNSDN